MPCQLPKVSPVVYATFILFGMGSWITINGLWMELPLLVSELPEGWSLPSYLSVIIQAANVGPIAYAIYANTSFFNEKMVIYLLIIVDSAAAILLVFFWDVTTVIAGEHHSTALFILTFFMGLGDATSSVAYFPFLAAFKSGYVTAYCIGEGMSGLLPGVVSLLQGVGDDQLCSNGTANGTSYPLPPNPLFGPDIFFLFLFAMMVVSGVAFTVLTYWPRVKSERVPVDVGTPYVDETPENRYPNIVGLSLSFDDEEVHTSCHVPNEAVFTATNHVGLLLLTGMVCFMSNGGLPSIQSYSALPYGNLAYHLTVTLSQMANPSACLLALWFPAKSVRLVWFYAVMGLLCSCYIVYCAVSSPVPPLIEYGGGRALLIASWIACVGFFSYTKVSIAIILQSEGKRALLWFGGVTQLGSALGASVAFILVNLTPLFESYNHCA